MKKILWMLSWVVVFSTHLFLRLHRGDKFIEYDLHILTLVTSFLAFTHVLQSLHQTPQLIYRHNAWSPIILGTAALTIANAVVNLESPQRVIYVTLVFLFLGVISESYSKFSERNLEFIIGTFFSIILSHAKIEAFLLSIPVNTTLNAGENSNYLASALPFLLSIFLSKQMWQKKWGKISSLLVSISILSGLYQIIHYQTRTAIIATTICALVIFIKHPVFSQFRLSITVFIKNKRAFITIILVVLALETAGLIILNRDSVSGRWLIWMVSLKMLSKYAFSMGLGINKFKDHYNNFQADFIKNSKPDISLRQLADDTFFSFNEYLQLGIEYGVLIYIPVGLLLYNVIKVLIGKFKSSFEFGAALSILSIFICSLSSYPLRSSSIMVNLFFFIGVLTSHSKLHQRAFVSLQGISATATGLIILTISVYSSIMEVQRGIALHDWKSAAMYSLESKFNKAHNLYLKSKTYLEDDGNFLYNYGSELYVNGHYQRSLTELISAQRKISHTGVYIYLGLDYQRFKNWLAAEKSFETAANIKPSMYLPKYLLLQLYIQSKQNQKARLKALEIITYPVKIPSEKINRYKIEAQQFLNEISQN